MKGSDGWFWWRWFYNRLFGTLSVMDKYIEIKTLHDLTAHVYLHV